MARARTAGDPTERVIRRNPRRRDTKPVQIGKWSGPARRARDRGIARQDLGAASKLALADNPHHGAPEYENVRDEKMGIVRIWAAVLPKLCGGSVCRLLTL